MLEASPKAHPTTPSCEIYQNPFVKCWEDIRRQQKAYCGMQRHTAVANLYWSMTGSCWSSCSLQKAPWRHKVPAKVLNIWRNCLEHQTFLKIWQHFWVLQPQRIDKVSMATCQAKCLWHMQIEHFTNWRRISNCPVHLAARITFYVCRNQAWSWKWRSCW
jgi:hypothetical protein